MSARRNAAGTLLAAILLTAACQIHSPGQLELARSLLSRYTASFAESLAITESLPAEEERLLATYRNNFKLISSTEELALLETSWDGLADNADALDKQVKDLRTRRTTDQSNADTATKELQKVRAPLAATLTQLNTGLKAADAATTLNDRLTFIATTVNGAIANIGSIQKALTDAAAAAKGKSDMDRLTQATSRLVPLVPNLEKYFETAVMGPTRAKGQNSSLAVEATRLARDILAVEVDIIDQEIAYHEELSGLAAEMLQSLPREKRLGNLTTALKKHPFEPDGTKTIAATLKTLAQMGDSQEEFIQPILEDAGTWYYVQVQANRADQVFQLRSRILGYRQTKLLDLAYDRQRRTLISYGLLAAVRYAEGGWKSQDTANLLSLIQAGLQAGLLAKL